MFRCSLHLPIFTVSPLQLHEALQHPDDSMLEHTKELITQLNSLGIMHTSADQDEDSGEDDWEDVDESDEDVEMS